MADKEKRSDDGIRRRINDSLEDHGADLERARAMSRGRRAPVSPPFFTTPTKPDYAAERDLERGDYDAAPPMASPSGRGPESGYAKGGRIKNYCKGGKVISSFKG